MAVKSYEATYMYVLIDAWGKSAGLDAKQWIVVNCRWYVPKKKKEVDYKELSFTFLCDSSCSF